MITPYEPAVSKGLSATDLYVALRLKENRIAADEELIRFPEVAANHPYYNEWRLRRKSCNQLLTHIRRKRVPLNILEVGCGNGWLSNRMASVVETEVTGLDINDVELAQASRVFNSRSNLHFVKGDLRDGIVSENSYDLIVFAASIQYFPSLQEIMNKARKQLSKGGEIYIMDSMFYDRDEIINAKQRSLNYFAQLGFPEMINCYYHHPLDELAGFNPNILYKPGKLMHRLLYGKCPFFRLIIKADCLNH